MDNSRTMSYIFRMVVDILRSKLRASSSLRQTDHSDSVSCLMVWSLFPRSTTENLNNQTSFGRFFTKCERKLWQESQQTTNKSRKKKVLSVSVRVFFVLKFSTTLSLVCFFYFFHETFQNNIVLEGNDFREEIVYERFCRTTEYWLENVWWLCMDGHISIINCSELCQVMAVYASALIQTSFITLLAPV